MVDQNLSYGLVVALLLGLAGLFPQFCVHAEVFMWPKPQIVAWENGPMIVLNSTFRINAPANLELQSAVKRYSALIRTERWHPVQVSKAGPGFLQTEGQAQSVLKSLDVVVDDLAADLQHGVLENYQLIVRSGSSNATLVAITVWGAMRGLETFSQLVRLAGRSRNAPLIIESGVTIKDYPNFPHRGVLLDVARNFYPVKAIKRTIRALSYNKLNVLHLHLTDSQSFPLEIHSEPDLAAKGSLGSQFTYSQADIRHIVRYARFHGVRVIPEIDAPGHAASWGGAHPDIVTCLNEFWLPTDQWSDRYASEPGAGQLNPLTEKTYEVVKNVINDVAVLFPDEFYHAGGDEIAPACWRNNTLVADFLAASSNHTLGELLTRFIDRERGAIKKHNKTVLYWEDILLDGKINVSSSHLPPATTILQTWNNGPISTKATTSAGYRTIVSSSDFYYLDCGHGGWIGNDSGYDQNFNDDPANTFNYGGLGGSYCAPFKTWARIYDYDITANLTREEAALVLGGEVALWSEQADATVLDAKLWPRSSALAESLWSGNRDQTNSEKKRSSEAINRLNDWRYRLVRRGINAEPLQPLWCLKNPRMCNLAY